MQSEKFSYAGKTVIREAGDKGARQHHAHLRQQHPQSFADSQILLWSQPAAVVDSVLYRWQLELEKTESQQAVNLVDMFTGKWTGVTAGSQPFAASTDRRRSRLRRPQPGDRHSLCQPGKGSLGSLSRGPQEQDEGESQAAGGALHI